MHIPNAKKVFCIYALKHTFNYIQIKHYMRHYFKKFNFRENIKMNKSMETSSNATPEANKIVNIK